MLDTSKTENGPVQNLTSTKDNNVTSPRSDQIHFRHQMIIYISNLEKPWKINQKSKFRRVLFIVWGACDGSEERANLCRALAAHKHWWEMDNFTTCCWFFWD